MSIKSNIKKILFLSLAIAAGAGFLVLVIAAITKKNHANCTGTEIKIEAKENMFFLSKQDILRVIMAGRDEPLTGSPLASFDLKKMEASLEQNLWVQDAQLFFDNNGQLHITVKERVPVARLFTVSGNSFYIDSSGKLLPLSSHITMKLPVYSNFPVDKGLQHGTDSVLLQQIKEMSPFILNNPFWMAQIAQIDITPNRTFEMIPVAGKHLIIFGDGTDYEQKFHRLFLFYQQVAAKIGLDKYTAINVQYKDQVVATKRGNTGKIDSLQALKNIQKLIDASHMLQNDTVSTIVDKNIATSAAASPTLTILKDRRKNASSKDSFSINPPSSNPISLKNPPKKPQKPKAVMKKANG